MTFEEVKYTFQYGNHVFRIRGRTMDGQTTRWLNRYELAGIETIPLKQNEKCPICKAWQITPSADQWDTVGPGSFNIGIRAGQGLAIIDCDAPQTTEAISDWSNGLGLNLPTVQTQSGNRHFYLKCDNIPAGINWQRLAIGPGELRARNSYVVAPCSAIDGRLYQFITGNPEEISILPPIAWADIAWLIDPEKYVVNPELESLPIRLLKRSMPSDARKLLKACSFTDKGDPIGQYVSRNEAEGAVVAKLILAGWTFDEILHAFEQYRPGHFIEQRNPAEYLRRVYNWAVNSVTAKPIRVKVAENWHIARVAPWPGRAGSLDRLTYLGLLSIAYQCNNWKVRASQRHIALYAGASQRGISNSLKRLQEIGLVKKSRLWYWDDSSTQTEATTYTVKKVSENWYLC
jgi:hypothetical protein